MFKHLTSQSSSPTKGVGWDQQKAPAPYWNVMPLKENDIG